MGRLASPSAHLHSLEALQFLNLKIVLLGGSLFCLRVVLFRAQKGQSAIQIALEFIVEVARFVVYTPPASASTNRCTAKSGSARRYGRFD
jgi:hypothetical protein